MKHLRQHLIFIFTGLIAFSSGVSAEDVIKETPSGGINWTQGVVFAHGFGTAKPNLSAGQRRILSRRAAVEIGRAHV